MRSVITGVAGFVGSSLADRLLELGHEVVGIDCFSDYYPKELKLQNISQAREHQNFTFIEGDLLELDLEDALEGADYVFHQAAQAGVRASWGESFLIYTNTNILATQKLLEAAKSDRVSSTLKKVVYASSSSVYGDAEALPTHEELLPQPISPYGVSKLACEHLMVLYTKEFSVPTISLRYFTVYGPRQRPDMAFNKFIRAGLTGEEITLFDDGEQSRDFTFISDVLDANIAAAEAQNKELVFNIGGGSRVTVNQVLEKIEALVEKPLNIQRYPRQRGDVRHTSADTTRAASELGYQPSVDLERGLEAEVKWLRALLEATPT